MTIKKSSKLFALQSKKSAKGYKRKSTISNKNFPLVGIGASAGGLEALTELLMNLPPDIGMAFVIVQHLDPTHESMIDEILSRKTLMTVTQIKKNTRVQANHVYVIPPNSSLDISHNILKILPRANTKGIHLPIDSFFKSLALDLKNKCIGIILSGTGSDGTHGLESIKAEGGFTIAQDPKSAKYDGMPRSAILAGAVDLVLSPKKIGEELARIAKHPITISEKSNILLSANKIEHDIKDVLGKILTLLHSKCHVDFSHYKRTTLNRRISRRMVLAKTKNLREYLEYLENQPEEIDRLFADILINVTEFFRDPNAFKHLKIEVLAKIIKNREASSPVRIWIVGCATGEEAYSIIMSLLEAIEETVSTKPQIQVFATDISEAAIQKARAGIYPETINKNVSKERLERFFTKTETGYKIKNFVRDVCLFSWHDVISDPPYAKLDLICCRNLLIYFDQALQEHLLPIFHYALKPNGFLILGISESIGKLTLPFFDLIDKKNKFYTRKSAPSMHKFYFQQNTYLPEKLNITKKFSEKTLYSSNDMIREVDLFVALKYAPPGIVINSAMEIIHIRGEIAPYLQWTTGQPSFYLFKVVRAELASALRMTIRAAKKKNASARKNGCTLQVGEQLKTFNIDITPFTFTPISQIKERHFLISFEPERSVPVKKMLAITSSKIGKRHIASQDQYIKELEQEQADAKLYQKSLILDFEITQEELTSSNEELQTTLEELQSTNEELETAKEELQSSNEELTTVNDELQIRNMDLAKLNDDLVNLLTCVDIPIVMVGIDGCIRRFTPTAAILLNFIQSDIGRPISDINTNFDHLDLWSLVLEVIKYNSRKELNVQDRKGLWFRLQIHPYKTAGNKIDGAVITLMDINLLQKNLIESESSLDYVNSIANTVRLPLVVLDKKLHIKSANHAFYEKFQTTTDEKETDLLTLIGMNKEMITDVRKMLTTAFVANNELKDLEVKYNFSTVHNGTILLNGRRIKWIDEEEPNALLLSLEDITDRLEMVQSLKEATAASDKANMSKDIFLATLSHELRTPLTAILCWAQLLLKIADADEFKQGLRTIEQNSKIQGQLIDDLLDISRIQSGKMILNISQVDPCDVVHQAVESIHSLAAHKSIIIQVHIKSLNGTVAADSARLQQIVWNLLTNAIKFSAPNKKINIYIKPIKKQGKRFAAIQVVDQGKGIHPDFIPQLFDRFTQADSSTTRLHSGLGLGLTIAHDLLKLLGGTIQAKSAGEGKGATFTVLLPLVPISSKHTRKIKRQQSTADAASWQSLKGLHILIVEDDPSSLAAITELLRFAGATTFSATSAEEAMLALQRYKPDILISDISMPLKDGIHLIQDIRANRNKKIREILSIALTAYTAKEDIHLALKTGFNAHMAKPFNAVDLIACIANLTYGNSR